MHLLQQKFEDPANTSAYTNPPIHSLLIKSKNAQTRFISNSPNYRLKHKQLKTYKFRSNSLNRQFSNKEHEHSILKITYCWYNQDKEKNQNPNKKIKQITFSYTYLMYLRDFTKISSKKLNHNTIKICNKSNCKPYSKPQRLNNNNLKSTLIQKQYFKHINQIATHLWHTKKPVVVHTNQTGNKHAKRYDKARKGGQIPKTSASLTNQSRGSLQYKHINYINFDPPSNIHHLKNESHRKPNLLHIVRHLRMRTCNPWLNSRK